jgi:hypothetical protein
MELYILVNKGGFNMKNVFIAEPLAKPVPEFMNDYHNVRKFIKALFPDEEVKTITSFSNDQIDYEREDTNKYKLLHVLRMIQYIVQNNIDLVVFVPGWKEYRGFKILHSCCVEYGIEFIEYGGETNA